MFRRTHQMVGSPNEAHTQEAATAGGRPELARLIEIVQRSLFFSDAADRSSTTAMARQILMHRSYPIALRWRGDIGTGLECAASGVMKAASRLLPSGESLWACCAAFGSECREAREFAPLEDRFHIAQAPTWIAPTSAAI